jgi:23S rRNA (cytidine1920-2'-O)/16S rRNA (cytidine1409-2'-O)-methyltransferase
VINANNACGDLQLFLIFYNFIGGGTMEEKERLDILIIKKGLVKSRNVSGELIKEGKVLVDGKKILKPGAKVSIDAKIEIKERPKYVSRGGLKLERALDAFEVDVKDLIVADIGASTGGFTDCLLQRGAKHVYAIDVGHGQLAEELRKDPRVSVYEKTDIRKLKALPEKVDLATIDVSFISLTLILPHVQRLLKPRGQIIALLKPQFEVGRGRTKKGIVKNKELREQTVEKIKQWAEENNYKVKAVTESPIKGTAGNIEYLFYLEFKG